MRLILVVMICIFIQFEYIDSYKSKTQIPLIMDTEASQWLSTYPMPYRWHQKYSLQQQSSDEIDRSLKQLEIIKDNGIRQFDTQSIDGVSMEVIYEYNKRGRKPN